MTIYPPPDCVVPQKKRRSRGHSSSPSLACHVQESVEKLSGQRLQIFGGATDYAVLQIDDFTVNQHPLFCQPPYEVPKQSSANLADLGRFEFLRQGFLHFSGYNHQRPMKRSARRPRGGELICGIAETYLGFMT